MLEFLSSEYSLHLLILIGIYLILAQGYNLSFGLAGLFNLAHIAVYAVAAYTTALLSTELGAPSILSLLASVLCAGLFSLLLGLISLRLSEEYFAIGTLAFAASVQAVLTNWKSLTRGVLGIPGIPRPDFFGFDFYDNGNFLALVILLALMSLFLIFLVFRGKFARALRAGAEFEPSALALGIDLRGLRNMSFFLSSCLAGISGFLFSSYLNYIDPSSFALEEMVFVFTIVVVGRPGSFWGVLGATFFLVLLPEPLRFTQELAPALAALFSLSPEAALVVPVLSWFLQFMNFISSPGVLGPMRQLLYAVILFLVVYRNRAQLFPKQRTI